MSYQNLGRDVPDPPNHAAAVKHTKDEGGTYGEALQRTDMQEKLKQYENLQGQGWFHPDIVNELRSQLAAAQAVMKQINDVARDYVREDLALRTIREKSHQPDTSCLDAYIDEAVDKSQRDYLWSRSELRRELLSLRKALEPFAHIANEIPTNRQQLGILTDDDFTNARTAMKQGSELYKEIIAGAQQPLVDALQELHDDIAEYAAINNLGGFQNHAMQKARAALANLKEQP